MGQVIGLKFSEFGHQFAQNAEFSPTHGMWLCILFNIQKFSTVWYMCIHFYPFTSSPTPIQEFWNHNNCNTLFTANFFTFSRRNICHLSTLFQSCALGIDGCLMKMKEKPRFKVPPGEGEVGGPFIISIAL